MDTELFNLCKEVYTRTGWKIADNFYFYAWTANGHKLTDVKEGKYKGKGYDDIPLYTSDYLLEKLPVVIEAAGVWKWPRFLTVERPCPAINQETYWRAMYRTIHKTYLIETADTPLKALLKLVIALDDAKELK